MAVITSEVLSFFTKNFPDWKVILLGSPPGLLWAFLCLVFAGYLKRKFGLKTGYTRKIFHILIFLSVATIHELWGTPAVFIFGTVTTIVIFYAVFRGSGNLLYEAMAREKDEPHRTHFIVVAYPPLV